MLSATDKRGTKFQLVPLVLVPYVSRDYGLLASLVAERSEGFQASREIATLAYGKN